MFRIQMIFSSRITVAVLKTDNDNMLHVEKDHVELYQLPEEIYRYCICSQKLFPRKGPNIFGVES